MLEFARQQWLWLFALAVLWWLAWLFARRFKPVRVTHAALWQRVAARVLPPAWKRLLRTVLTWLIAISLLACIVTYAAGLQRPEAEKPAPLYVVIVIDNSVSMSARSGDTTRIQEAVRLADRIYSNLSPDEFSLRARFEDGQPVLGQWQRGGRALETPFPPPVDYAPQDLEALRAALATLKPPPGMPATPAPQPLLIWIGDDPPPLPPLDAPARLQHLGLLYDLGWPTFVHTVGGPADNDALTAARFEAASPEDSHAGTLVVETLSGRPATFSWTAGSQSGRESGLTFTLPITRERLQARVFLPDDGLALDNELRFQHDAGAIADVFVSHPASDTEANPFLVDALREFLPGRDVRSGAPAAAIDTDLLVMDRALVNASARYRLCFGVIPPEYGRVSEATRVDPNLQPQVEAPPGLRFTLPKLALLSAREAVPLANGHTLTTLARAPNGETLIALGENLLYCGFIPHESTLLQDREGLLLLLRWIQSVQGARESLLPPALPMAQESRLQLPPGNYRLRGAAEYALATSADGEAKVGPFRQPGVYSLHDARGAQVGSTTVLLHDPPEQRLPWRSMPALEPHKLRPPELQPDWRDHLPAALLYVALALLVFEWLAWLVGLTE